MSWPSFVAFDNATRAGEVAACVVRLCVVPLKQPWWWKTPLQRLGLGLPWDNSPQAESNSATTVYTVSLTLPMLPLPGGGGASVGAATTRRRSPLRTVGSMACAVVLPMGRQGQFRPSWAAAWPAPPWAHAQAGDWGVGTGPRTPAACRGSLALVVTAPELKQPTPGTRRRRPGPPLATYSLGSATAAAERAAAAARSIGSTPAPAAGVAAAADPRGPVAAATAGGFRRKLSDRSACHHREGLSGSHRCRGDRRRGRTRHASGAMNFSFAVVISGLPLSENLNPLDSSGKSQAQPRGASG